MQTVLSEIENAYVVRFEPRDRTGALAARFTAEEWAAIPRLAVDRFELLSMRYGVNEQRLVALVEAHIDAYEQRCFLLRPGGWDANGAPV